MNKRIVRHVFDWLWIATGSMVMALAFNLFLEPTHVVPGGVTGLAMILKSWIGTPIGMVTIVANIPLFFLGVRVLGKSYGIKSVAGLLLSSVMIDFFSYVLPIPPATMMGL